MMKMIEKEEPDLTFVQEPYEYQKWPFGIKTKCRTFTAGKGKHTAASVMPNNIIEAMLIIQISNEDAVCLEIIHENIKYFAVCRYLDIEEQIENSFTKIDQILQFAEGARILIANDSNSQSKTLAWQNKKYTRQKTGGKPGHQTSPYNKWTKWKIHFLQQQRIK